MSEPTGHRPDVRDGGGSWVDHLVVAVAVAIVTFGVWKLRQEARAAQVAAQVLGTSPLPWSFIDVATDRSRVRLDVRTWPTGALLCIARPTAAGTSAATCGSLEAWLDAIDHPTRTPTPTPTRGGRP